MSFLYLLTLKKQTKKIKKRHLIDGSATSNRTLQLTSGITVQDYINNLDGTIYESHGPFGETERIDNSASAAMTLMPMGATRAATGPAKQWLRMGKSFSREGGFSTFGVRWGASPAGNGKYIKQINAKDFKTFNQYLRGLKLPGNNWRTADPGHFHFWKK